MDEADKYQQRLLAIAEKRRIQEEQERAKREMEDEKLRLQQLKRKSLRDQWLMEGPPASPDSTGPRSPLWGSQAQEMEERIDKLQTDTERLAEEEERLQRHTEDDSTAPDSHTPGQDGSEGVANAEEELTDTGAPQGVPLENGKAVGKDIDVVQPSPELHRQAHNALETAVTMATDSALTNGGGEGESTGNAAEEDELPRTNGLASEHGAGVDVGGGAVTLTFLGFSEAEPGQGVDMGDDDNDDDDDCGAIMRAERVIITDEGDELPELQDPLAENSGTLDEVAESLEGVEAEPHVESSVALEDEAEIELPQSTDTTADNTETEVKNSQGGTVDVEVEAEAQQEAEVPDAAETQLSEETLEGSVEVCHVPVYSATQPSLTPAPEIEEEAAQPQPIKEGDTLFRAPQTTGQFQVIPLDGPSSPTEPSSQQSDLGQSAEQEPLLESKALTPSEAHGPSRAEAGDAPKQKTCQCCSVM